LAADPAGDDGPDKTEIKDPGVFFKEVAGTRDIYTVDDLEQQLRNQVVASMTAAFLPAA
jgi:membrane protease subunit (stomatin/prohibitin family)